MDTAVAGRASRRSSRNAFAVTVLAAMVALGSLASGPASAGTTETVFFVHGFEVDSGVDCSKAAGMVSALRNFGWSGQIYRLKYYSADVNCSPTISGYGSHRAGGGTSSNHKGGSTHYTGTPIEHLSYHLAWYLYTNYSSKGITVKAIGHSMGGLILRSAIARVQQRVSGFPSYLRVSDVVTWGSPHNGIGTAAAYACSQVPSTQCKQMLRGSAFLNWLNEKGMNPQGSGGTDWTAVGSIRDEVVSQESATYMSACHMVRYQSSANIKHGSYVSSTSSTNNAEARVRDCDRNGGAWWTWYSSPWPVRGAYYALASPKF